MSMCKSLKHVMPLLARAAILALFVKIAVVGLIFVTTNLQADGNTEDHPGHGRLMSTDEVSNLPTHVFADGSGLPKGSGFASDGMPLYVKHCADCHGNVGQGGRALELVGDRALLATNIPDKGIAVYWPYAPTLFEYIRRAMPPEKPYSLSVNEVYAIVAHLLELNGLSSPDQLVNAKFLSNLEMPNRNGFSSQFD